MYDYLFDTDSGECIFYKFRNLSIGSIKDKIRQLRTHTHYIICIHKETRTRH